MIDLSVQLKTIRETYNSGKVREAVELSEKLMKEHPDNLKVQYTYYVMHGDYSYSPELSEDEKQSYLNIAKEGMKKLFLDPKLDEQHINMQYSIRNEYFWFFELPKEQYELGVKGIEAGREGSHYSACVGASMMSLKEHEAGRIEVAPEWANKCLNHFHEFEKISPTWYNINYFSAQALAVLGRYDEALENFKGMFRKQGAEDNQLEIDEFLKKVEKLKKS